MSSSSGRRVDDSHVVGVAETRRGLVGCDAGKVGSGPSLSVVNWLQVVVSPDYFRETGGNDIYGGGRVCGPDGGGRAEALAGMRTD